MGRGVLQHLDALRDGTQLLQMYDAELTADAIQAVRAAAEVRDHLVAQFRAVGELSTQTAAAAGRIDAQLATERPWREIAGLAADLALVRDAYTAERKRLLQWQEQRAEQARARIKARDGVGMLSKRR